MIYGEILAGGKGTRMGNTEMPKQFLILGKKPIIVHTLEQFLLNGKFDKILVVCPKEWLQYTKDIVNKYISNREIIDVVEGGTTRNETIMNGCRHIQKHYGLTKEDIIVTHDAVRPFLNQRILNENIEMAKVYSAVDTVVSAFDTIVESTNGDFITNIPQRQYMYQGQTPQSFNILELMRLYDSLSAEEREILTDACKIFSLKGQKVKLVNGEIYNMKITTLHDLKLANAILMERGEND